MPKSLSFDAILTALAVVAAGTTGCAKAAPSVSAEPAPAAQPSVAVTTATGNVNPAAEPPSAPVAAMPQAAVVDAGVERAKRAAPGGPKKGSAACGAGSCSEEMKK